jgi:hypothetical protein
VNLQADQAELRNPLVGLGVIHGRHAVDLTEIPL